MNIDPTGFSTLDYQEGIANMSFSLPGSGIDHGWGYGTQPTTGNTFGRWSLYNHSSYNPYSGQTKAYYHLGDGTYVNGYGNEVAFNEVFDYMFAPYLINIVNITAGKGGIGVSFEYGGGGYYAAVDQNKNIAAFVFDSGIFGVAVGNGGKYSIDNAVDWLDKYAHSSWKDAEGECGTYVRRAIEAGFGLNKDALKGKTTDQTGYAKNMGSYLQILGFQSVNTTNFLKGDIAIIQSYEGGNPAGHAQMYNGSIWISDFKQLVDFWPGGGYRTYHPSFEIFRWNN